MSTPQSNEFQTHQHRLLMVAKALRESPNPHRFDMSDVLHTCGTPACAFGHYVCRSDLQDFVKPELSVYRDTNRDFWRPVFVDTGEYASFSGLRVGEHFGLTADEQDDLFSGGGCGCADTAIEAAEYIERFVERKYPLPALLQTQEPT